MNGKSHPPDALYHILLWTWAQPHLCSAPTLSSKMVVSATPDLFPKALPPSPLRAFLSSIETKGMDLNRGLSDWLPLSLVF